MTRLNTRTDQDKAPRKKVRRTSIGTLEQTRNLSTLLGFHVCFVGQQKNGYLTAVIYFESLGYTAIRRPRAACSCTGKQQPWTTAVTQLLMTCSSIGVRFSPFPSTYLEKKDGVCTSEIEGLTREGLG